MNTHASDSPLFLANDSLKVEIAPPPAYASTRFGKGAFITQVTCLLNGASHTFCINELDTDGKSSLYSGGSGLCHEFGIFKAVGYADAKIGEWFPKIDAGLLQRYSAGKYEFFGEHKIRPFPMTVKQDGQVIRFISEPVESSGYAVKLEQRLEIIENRLHIKSHLENCGSKAIATDEYRHNFLAFDGRGPESGLRLRVPVELNPADFPKEIASVSTKDGISEICWNQAPDPHFFREWMTPQPATWWEMEWPGSPLGIREEASVPMSEFHLFATPRLISPEVFLNIALQPGEVLDWERIYTFYPTQKTA